MTSWTRSCGHGRVSEKFRPARELVLGILQAANPQAGPIELEDLDHVDADRLAVFRSTDVRQGDVTAREEIADPFGHFVETGTSHLLHQRWATVKRL